MFCATGEHGGVHGGGGPRGWHVAAHAGVAWSACAYAQPRRKQDKEVGMQRAKHGILRKVPLETLAQTERERTFRKSTQRPSG
jgi:hypothetical protein